MDQCLHLGNVSIRAWIPTNLSLFLYRRTREHTLDSSTLVITMLIGAAGGFLGGLFGIGGGTVIIPLLTMAQGSNPHLYEAASFVISAVVSMGSIPRHIRAHAIQWTFAFRSLPFSLATVGGGIALGLALPNPVWLERIFAVFLAYVAGAEVIRRLRRHRSPGNRSPQNPRTSWPCAGIIGTAMGTLSGLLGIGGGMIAVPLMHAVNRFNIRAAIATSAFLVLPTVIVGAIVKYATLEYATTPEGAAIPFASAIWLALALAPGAFIGANLGSMLVHKVPMKHLSIGFAVLCALLAIRMAGFGS